MKKSAFIHIGWALVALASFLLGSHFMEEKNASRESSQNAPSNAAVQSSRSGNDSSSEKRTLGNRSRSLGTAQNNLSEAEIKALGLELKTAKGPLARRLAFSKILEALTPENATLLREQILYLDQNSPEFREFHYAWGSLAGKDAVLLGEESPERDMSATLAGWMSADPATALAWLKNLPADQANGNLKWGAIRGLTDNDPTQAAHYAVERFESGDRDARRMVNIALDALLKTTDPQDLASMSNFVDALPDGELTDSANQHLARVQARQDPVSASEWARTLPVGNGKNQALGTSFHIWADRDPVAAAEKIATLSGTEKDAATFGYATRVVRDDPAVGVQWAAQIKDESSRQRALVETGRVYYRRDRDAAREWLASSGLSEEQQQQVTRRGRRRRR